MVDDTPGALAESSIRHAPGSLVAGGDHELLEHIGYACIALDISANVTYANAMARGLGSGETASIFMEDAFRRGFDAATASGKVVKVDHFHHSHGRWYTASIHPIPGGGLVFLRDAGWSVELDQRSRTILEYAQDGITLLNPDLTPVFHGAGNEEILGYGTDNPYRNYRDIIVAADLPAFEQAASGLASGETVSLEHRVRHGRGGEIWLRAALTNRLQDPGTRALVLNFRDVTAERMIGQELEQRRAELDAVEHDQMIRTIRLDALHQISRITAGWQENLYGMMAEVVRIAAPEGGIAGRVYMVEDGLLQLAGGYGGNSASVDPSRTLAWRALLEDRLIITTDGSASDNRPVEGMLEAGYRSALALPFDYGGHPGAVLVLAEDDILADPDVQRYVESIAGYVASAVASNRMVRRLERNSSDYQALARFGQQIETITGLDDLMRQGLESLHGQLRLSYSVVVDISGSSAVPRYWHGLPGSNLDRLMGRRIDIAGTFLGDAVTRREVVFVGKDTGGAQPLKGLAGLELHAALAVPILVQGQVRHAMILANNDTHGLIGETEISIAGLFAQRIANAMERVQHLGEITATREATFRALGHALEYRDYETRGHTDRVTRLMELFARAVGFDAADLEGLVWGAYLHDLGKLSVPDQILLKPASLTSDEYDVVKLHPLHGAEMCRDIPFLPDSTHAIVRHHHERWDGTGYPDGLKGSDIPVPARMFALVDVFDALTAERVYKRAWSHEQAVAELRALAGKQFDPELVEIFIEAVLPQATD